ncbi:hypothetical protein [Vibrio cyclitrophicus]|uniref:hypothetical protein n=1 Tax=Vibrio sp. R78045 TaxID=3093868 RepID=UPI00354B615A
MKSKIVALICEKPFLGDEPLSNPSLYWFSSRLGDNTTYVMRGSKTSNGYLSMPDTNSTFELISKTFTNSAFRAELRNSVKKVSSELDTADIIWIRGPSLVPFILSRFWKKKYREKSFVHICANRFTFNHLKYDFNFKNLIRYGYGCALTGLIQFLQKKGVTFFYTGSQVADNFKINNGNYLIDFVSGGVDLNLELNVNSLSFISLGRLSKLANNSEFNRFVSMANSNVDIYGPGDSSIKIDGVSNLGTVLPSEISSILDGYNVVICITNEYYEGFPRVIAEAVCKGLWVVVTKESVFLKDIIDYPKLIISEDIISEDGLHEKIGRKIDINKMESFVELLQKRSEVDL